MPGTPAGPKINNFRKIQLKRTMIQYYWIRRVLGPFILNFCLSYRKHVVPLYPRLPQSPSLVGFTGICYLYSALLFMNLHSWPSQCTPYFAASSPSCVKRLWVQYGLCNACILVVLLTNRKSLNYELAWRKKNTHKKQKTKKKR
jgi:hypothetical protein